MTPLEAYQKDAEALYPFPDEVNYYGGPQERFADHMALARTKHAAYIQGREDEAKARQAEIEALQKEIDQLREENRWIPITESSKLPLEIMLLIKHKYGIEAVMFWRARWRYRYSGSELPDDFWQNATHWIDPENL